MHHATKRITEHAIKRITEHAMHYALRIQIAHNEEIVAHSTAHSVEHSVERATVHLTDEELQEVQRIREERARRDACAVVQYTAEETNRKIRKVYCGMLRNSELAHRAGNWRAQQQYAPVMHHAPVTQYDELEEGEIR
ncbi:hypothetical protein NEFER03_0065 [Nematocida sp. LUAm3]|nr:hypothetical protein NEFER03_0065 [Nematocida sp. LUAm3]KAI5173518.1 hypothetical protein NEFER02_0034 [Nematocida sp. LUAm2]